MGKVRKKLRGLCLRVVGAKGAPQQVAGGLAVGVFWAVSPLWGFQMILAFVSATILKCSRIPAVIAVHASNFFTAFFIYPVTWAIGDLLLRPFMSSARAVVWAEMAWTWHTLLDLAGQTLIRMLLGGFLLGAVLGVVTYVLALPGIVGFRQTLKLRREANQLKRITVPQPRGHSSTVPSIPGGPN